MSAGAASPFDARADAWKDWQAQPWGRLRYEVVAHTVSRALAGLPPGRLRVVDSAGATVPTASR